MKKIETKFGTYMERENDPTKFDIFIAAKQAGINIGLLSSLIQAGTLSSYTHRRSRLVLEAQTFNILNLLGGLMKMGPMKITIGLMLVYHIVD